MKIKALDANEANYMKLENAGVISRIIPASHGLKPPKGKSLHKSLYESQSFGPHKLITVTINKQQVDHLIYHSENEDFWVIDHETEALVIIFSLLKADVFAEKLALGQVEISDLLAIKIPKNNPRFSFFTLHKGYPHMECVLKESHNPPNFFVTECRDMDENKLIIDMEVL